MISRFIEFRAPKEWRFIDPDTKYVYVENDKQSLINRVKAYRAQNSLPEITAIDVVIENYLCGLPENVGNCKKVELKKGWYGYLRGGVALLSQIFYGEEHLGDSTTAEARAMQCARCSLNVFPDRKGFPGWADSVAESMVGKRRVSIQDQLGTCGGCACPLRAKVWWKGEIVLTDKERATMRAAMPDCWQMSKVR